MYSQLGIHSTAFCTRTNLTNHHSRNFGNTNNNLGYTGQYLRSPDITSDLIQRTGTFKGNLYIMLYQQDQLNLRKEIPSRLYPLLSMKKKSPSKTTVREFTTLITSVQPRNNDNHLEYLVAQQAFVKANDSHWQPLYKLDKSQVVNHLGHLRKLALVHLQLY
jgi:hypothetical protein